MMLQRKKCCLNTDFLTLANTYFSTAVLLGSAGLSWIAEFQKGYGHHLGADLRGACWFSLYDLR